MKIILWSETIVTSEETSTYVWVVNMVAEMEPRWSISKIRLIFADNFITPHLLTKLCIKCALIYESSFGEVNLSQILQYLNVGLISYTKDQWDKAYNNALLILSDNPRKQLILKSIYDRATNYAGYHLFSIEVNLKCKGSTPDGQNHSSTVAYFGKGNSWLISTQSKDMTIRNQNHEKESTKYEEYWYVKDFNYKRKESNPKLITESKLAK